MLKKGYILKYITEFLHFKMKSNLNSEIIRQFIIPYLFRIINFIQFFIQINIQYQIIAVNLPQTCGNTQFYVSKREIQISLVYLL